MIVYAVGTQQRTDECLCMTKIVVNQKQLLIEYLDWIDFYVPVLFCSMNILSK